MTGTIISLAVFILFLLFGLAYTVFNDSYIRREHRKILLLIVGLCASLVIQNCWEHALIIGPTR